MRKHLIMMIAGALLFTAFLGVVSAENEITKTDPTGDFFTSGTVGDEVDDVDITQLRITYDTFPATVSLTVDGEIGVGAAATMSYTYMIMIDSTGNGEENIVATYTSILNQVTVVYGESDMEVLNPSLVTTENGDTLSLELAEKYFSSGTVHDISAMATVMDMGDSSSATDSVDFEGAGDDDTSDDDVDDDDWPDDDDDTEQLTDPKTETATDTSISVEIKDVSFDYDVSGGQMTIEIKITGTTSGSVHHCSSVMVTYDENGTMEDEEDNEWTVGPDGFDRMTMFGYTMEQHFRGTGDDGEDDWSEWEYYMYMDGPYDENMSMVDEDEIEEGKSAVFYVRAFSDEAETMWNQGSKDVTDEISGGAAGDDDDDSPIGAALIILGFIAAAGAITVFSGRRK